MDTLELLSKLIAYPTVSRLSNREITDFLQELITSWGGLCERVDYEDEEHIPKSNLIAKFGRGVGGLAYFSHTDVVPADTWSHHSTPFIALKEDGKIYGRGSCDMKGSIASFLSALQKVNPTSLRSPVYFVATADEEVGYKGASKVVESSRLYQEMVEHQTKGIIGEPTELKIMHAHKGVCGIKVTSHGKAAHSSTNLGKNANLAMIPFLQEMKAIYDESVSNPAWKNAEFNPPEISFNIGINDHTFARNITPGISICTLFFRPVPGFDVDSIITRIRNLAEAHQLEFALESLAYPMYREPNSEYLKKALSLVNQESSGTVSYGTDGAVYTGMKHLLLFGPGSIKQAHTDDEYIEIDQLLAGEKFYAAMIQQFCC